MFLSVTIQNHQNGITLLPYTITNIGQTETFCDIFTAILAKENLDENAKITAVYVGESSLKMSKLGVDIDSCIAHEICTSFGKFVKFECTITKPEAEVDVVPDAGPASRSIADVLMSTAKQLARQSHIPNAISINCKRTNQAKLHNAIKMARWGRRKRGRGSWRH